MEAFKMRISRLLAIVTCVVVALGACSQQPDPQTNTGNESLFLYGSDGNVQNGFAAFFKDEPGMLTGMKGTAPLAELTQDFRNRIAATDPNLKDLIFAGETYDAVVISAIAAQLAGTTNPAAIAKHINGVTIGADSCSTVAACLSLARTTGRDPAYRGVTLRHGFTPVGEPSTASYGVFHFGPNNLIDDGKTELLNTGNDRNAITEQPARPPVPGNNKNTGAPLVLGGLLPISGGLEFAYPPMIAGARLALKEINDAGGVLGQPVVWKDGNDFTDPTKALTTVAKHKADGVHVIIGPSGSAISLKVLPEVVKGGMILFSPSATAAALSNVEDSGMYFRTAPSDILQARALADVMLRDGVKKICLIAIDDAYGDGLMADVQKELTAAGVSASQIKVFQYEVGEDSMIAKPDQITDIARQVNGFEPDGVLVIGFEESAEVIKGLAKAGMRFRS
jgi:ABC-type branched-subunit amino acid transport system substrate-binding protein